MQKHSKRGIVALSGVRTPVGRFGGALADVPPADLAALVTREALQRSGLTPEDTGQVVFGHVIPTEPRDLYLARVAAVQAGLPVSVPAMNVNRLCGSGLQALVSAAQGIALGDCQVAVGGGAEAMSRGPYWLPQARWGARMGDGRMLDAMVAALTDPFDGVHMGITAENVAERWEVSREDQDQLALTSHHRAAAATAEGRFADQIVPVEVPTRKGKVRVTTDEHTRPGITEADLAELRPAFKPDGTVTAGNSSGINDAAAAVVLADAGVAAEHGLEPLARLVAYRHVGVEPAYMGIGPSPAISRLLEDTGLKVDDIDVYEVNEAFAAQALAVTRELGLPPERTNPNGSGIGLGHPVGATGAVLTVKALHELRRIGGHYAVVSMCIGGGQGIAALFEREGGDQ
ncbi:beta-ketothiolase BktB [Streptomyces sp. TP-A0356]|uniref:beta-ketothiolase BktB n=1 Tax=Streptomyces sp. TP-A0356 TaxID=1359208 RepID=UPI0006E3837B|nr:beta-ketothiolase BktB [Streptomyces sp. TP-A0356]